MKCPNCDGTGKAEIGVGAFTIHGADCDRCNGKGVVEPLTNEEWIKQCNTEQLAKELAFIDGYDDVDFDVLVKSWVEWLKQPHGGES